MELNSRGHVWAVVIVVTTLAACANNGQIFDQQLVHANFNSDRFPLSTVAYMEQHPPQDPLFTTDAWGGYVIYRAWPKVHTVVDDRHDMYGSDYMKRYLKIIDGEPDWNVQLQAMGAHSVLVPSTSALASLLRLTPEWKQVYDDGQAVLFESATR